MKKPEIVNLPKIQDPRGNLSFFESKNHIPFKIERTYWIYDVPGGASCGGHAYRKNEEFIVALSGSFDVVLHDGKQEYVFQLNRSYYGLYVPEMYWKEIRNFSTNSLAVIVASEKFNEYDYIRDFSVFKEGLKTIV